MTYNVGDYIELNMLWGSWCGIITADLYGGFYHVRDSHGDIHMVYHTNIISKLQPYEVLKYKVVYNV